MDNDSKAVNVVPDLNTDWILSVRNPFAVEGADGSVTFCRAPRDAEEKQLQLRILARCCQNPTDLVPPEMLALNRWVCWKFRIDHATGKITKPPHSPLTGEPIGANADWASHHVDFATARAAVKKFDLSGVGFVFVKDDHLVGLDFDHCVTNGVVHPMVDTWLRWFGATYAEFSPSGHGIHAICRGLIAKALTATLIPGADGATAELYDSNRYLTFTGQRVSAATGIADCQTGIEKLWECLAGSKQAAPSAGPRDSYAAMTPEGMRAKYAEMLAAFRAMIRPEDSQNEQLNKCAYFAARAHLAGALEKTEEQLKAELRAIAQSTQHCPSIPGTLRSGWESGFADGALPILDPQRAHAEALAWVDAQLADENVPIPAFEDILRYAPWLTDEEYVPRRRQLAKRFNVSRPDLDRLIRSRRPKLTEEPEAIIEFKNCEPWPEAVDGNQLLTKAASLLRRFIIFKHEHDAEVNALWALGTHLYEEFNIFPRLGITSPLPECGKTTALDVLEHLALRATRSDNLTTAVAFRIMEAYHPSLLLDELDTFIHDNPELIGVLNSGHKKGGYVWRMEKANDQQLLRRFGVYGPIAYGMIGHPTGTLFSRTLFIRLERKSAEQRTQDFDPDENSAVADELTTLRRQFVRWAADNCSRVKGCEPETAGLANRARNNWRPLLKIATVVGGEWPSTVLRAAGLPAPRSKKTDQEKILRDIRNVFHTRGVDRIPSMMLLSDLLLQTESGWCRYHNKRDPLDAADLADLLSDFDIGPKAFHVDKDLQKKLFDRVEEKTKVKRKGYTLEQLALLFEKYLTTEPEEVEVSKNVF